MATAAIALATSVQAQGRGNGKGHDRKHNDRDRYERRDKHDDRYDRRTGDIFRRDHDDRYYVPGNRRVPPGLAKKPGQMPPGQYKKHYSTMQGADVLSGIFRRRGYAVDRIAQSSNSRVVYYRGRDGIVRRALVSPGREDGGFRSPFHAELGKQVRDVVLHGLLGQEHALGDLAIREAFGDEVENFALLLAESSEALVLGGRCP